MTPDSEGFLKSKSLDSENKVSASRLFCALMIEQNARNKTKTDFKMKWLYDL